MMVMNAPSAPLVANAASTAIATPVAPASIQHIARRESFIAKAGNNRSSTPVGLINAAVTPSAPTSGSQSGPR